MNDLPAPPPPGRSSATVVGGDRACCAAYEQTARMHRRAFLSAAAAGGTLGTTVFGDVVRQVTFADRSEAAEAAPVAGQNVLVVVSLRGGIDGLGLVVPHGDPAYYRARPRIAVPRGSLLARDAMFGLHPELGPLLPYWRAGLVAAVHAVGLPMPNRSHFDAMEKIEDADPGSPERRGWVNRMVGLDDSQRATEAVHVNSTMTPTMLAGPAPTLSTQGLDKLRISGTDRMAAERYRSLSTSFSGSQGPLGDAARSALQVSRTYAGVLGRPYRPANGAVYPRGYPGKNLGDALKDTAQLIKAGVGARVVSLDFGSWDMHADYGYVNAGAMRNMVRGLGLGLAAFLRDLGTTRQRVTVVTISEFGRRVAENGNRGLDHGWGNVMLLMGAGVRGGRYYARWPGLGAGRLVDGDLRVTTDYRQVLGEVVNRRFGRSVTAVFPGLSYRRLGVMR